MTGARIAAHEARFCISGKPTASCWRFDPERLTITPVAELGPAGPDIVEVPTEDPLRRVNTPDAVAPVAPAPPWTARIVEDDVEVCGPSGCAPFAVRPPVDDDDERTYLHRVVISPGGDRLAVTRGEPVSARMSVEIYDRVSGKKLASPRPRTECILGQGFLGEHAWLTEWSCVDEGGDHLIFTAAGKLVRIAGEFMPRAPALALGGDRWMFRSQETLTFVDLARGKTLARVRDPDVRFAAAHGQLFTFAAGRGEVIVYDRAGKVRGRARAPSCSPRP